MRARRIASVALMALTACASPEAEPLAPPPPILDGGNRDVGADPDQGVVAPGKQERTFTLRINDAPSAPLTLDMNRDEVNELLGPVARDIVLLELDPVPLLRNIMREVKTACGTDWQRDAQDPEYDCSGTALGRTFAAPLQSYSGWPTGSASAAASVKFSPTPCRSSAPPRSCPATRSSRACARTCW
jgi:hypothetical protein